MASISSKATEITEPDVSESCLAESSLDKSAHPRVKSLRRGPQRSLRSQQEKDRQADDPSNKSVKVMTVDGIAPLPENWRHQFREAWRDSKEVRTRRPERARDFL
jgi:hypothetical protein